MPPHESDSQRCERVAARGNGHAVEGCLKVDNERAVALIDDLRAHTGEAPWFEFKVGVVEPEKIGKTISAISNGACISDKPQGYVVWGVENVNHDVVGTTFDPAKDKIKGQPYEFWMAGQLSPSINLQFTEVAHPNGKVIILEIAAAQRITTKFQGIAYIRIGEATPPLSGYPDREASLNSKLMAFNWEAGAASSFVSEEDVLKLLDFRSYFEVLEHPLPTSNALILETLAQERLISRDVAGRWNITNLGAMLFANDLADFSRVKRKALRIVRYKGKSKAADPTEFTVPCGYARGFKLMIDHLYSILPKSEEVRKAIRVETPIYPHIAIRELVANALIHQDMTISGSGPMIDIFEDRLEITNPGMPLIEPSRFLDAPPRSRNEDMAALLRRFGICEERGSGVKKVVANIEIYQLPAPDFARYEGGVRVSLFAPKRFGDMDTAGRVRACYQHAALMYMTNQKMTNASLRKRFGISKNNAAQVSKVISQAIESGWIRASEGWSPRQGHYLPAWASSS